MNEYLLQSAMEKMQHQAEVVQTMGIIAFIATVLSCIFLFVIMVSILKRRLYKEEGLERYGYGNYVADDED
ncbi:MAG: hypothetical protein K2L25_02385 [Alphaproteobacteria bacterium]|nr:hypothetical protein [Alphaproteobacteria bacterium]